MSVSCDLLVELLRFSLSMWELTKSNPFHFIVTELSKVHLEKNSNDLIHVHKQISNYTFNFEFQILV